MSRCGWQTARQCKQKRREKKNQGKRLRQRTAKLFGFENVDELRKFKGFDVLEVITKTMHKKQLSLAEWLSIHTLEGEKPLPLPVMELIHQRLGETYGHAGEAAYRQRVVRQPQAVAARRSEQDA